MSCINLYLALNSELHEVDWFKELSCFYKNCSTGDVNSDLLEFIFQTNLSDIYIMLLQHTKYSRALVSVTSTEIFSKLKL